MDIKGAWRILWRKKPPLLPDQLELQSLQGRSRFWSFLRYSLLPGGIGLIVVAVVIAVDAMHRSASPTEAGTSAALFVQSPDFLYHLGIEVGVAFLIAGLVSFFIEASARREQTHLLEESIRLMGSEVIQGVFRIRHDDAYVKSVVASCLAIHQIRRNYEVDCTVSEFDPAERERWEIASPSLLKVEAEITYWTENIGNEDGDFDGRYFIPQGLSGPRRFARLTYLEVGDRRYQTDDEIEKLELKEDHPDHLESDRGYGFNIPAHPRVPTKVHLRAEFAKERSDNEIFTFLRPTIGAKIRFRFNVGGLTVGVKARTASDMIGGPEIKPGRLVFWEVPNGALLPNNHVTVWWRSAAVSDSPEPDGLSEFVEASASAAEAQQTDASDSAGDGTPDATIPNQTGLRGWYNRARAAIQGALARAPNGSG